MATPTWKLYGVPLSQPFRSVAWTLLQKNIPFEVQLTVPGSTVKVGSRTQEYLAKSRTGRIPLLENTKEGYSVVESPAILSHLCERYGWDSLYGPPGSIKKASIDSYMHWHHHGTRSLAKLAFPFLRPDEASSPPRTHAETIDQHRKRVTLKALEDGWFSTSATPASFLAGLDDVSIADILAYEEIIQLTAMGLLKDEELKEYPRLKDWMQRMGKLPFHQEVHASLYSLGDVTTTTTMDDSSLPPISKRLSAATKTGLKALVEAQADFVDADEPQSKL